MSKRAERQSQCCSESTIGICRPFILLCWFKDIRYWWSIVAVWTQLFTLATILIFFLNIKKQQRSNMQKMWFFLNEYHKQVTIRSLLLYAQEKLKKRHNKKTLNCLCGMLCVILKYLNGTTICACTVCANSNHDYWMSVCSCMKIPQLCISQIFFNNKLSAVYIRFTGGWDYQMQIKLASGFLEMAAQSKWAHNNFIYTPVNGLHVDISPPLWSLQELCHK